MGTTIGGGAFPEVSPMGGHLSHDIRSIRTTGAIRLLLVLLVMLPAIHPLIRPLVGAPSHLLWFVLLVPVGFVAYSRGRLIGAVSAGGAALWTGVGEALFGAGYGVPADGPTILAMTSTIGFVGMLSAIMSGLLAEQEFRREVESRFATTAINGATLPTLLLDADGELHHANAAARDLLALPLDPAAARQELARRIPELRETVRSGAREFTTTVVTAAGVPTVHRLELAMIPSTRGSLGTYCALHDESALVRREEVERRAAVLQELGMVLASVAHEINGPLTTVRLATEELLRRLPGDPAALEEPLHDLAMEAGRAQDVARRLLNRVAGRPTAQETLDLSTVLRERRALWERRAAAHGIRFECHHPPGDLLVRGQRVEVEQILTNLVTNAEDAIRECARPGRIAVAAERRGDVLVITVTDDGPGIPPEAHDKLFQAFHSTKGAAGNGIGLAFSRRLAREMGGDLRFDATHGPGARFVLELKSGTPGDVAPLTVSTPAPAIAGGSGLALVVDDEPTIRRALGGMLEHLGYQVVTAATPQDAHHLADGILPTLIVSDRHLGTEDGLVLLGALEKRFPDARRILMTGDLDVLEAITREAPRTIGLLAKPFTMEEVVRAVQ